MTARVCVFGVDAMEPQLIHQWIDSGSLPNLARLRARGAWGSVLNPPRFFSGASWPNFYTGHVPARHDKYLRTLYDPKTLVHSPLRPKAQRDDAFWLSDGLRQKRTAIINLPYCPIDDRLNGVHLFDWYSHDYDHRVPDATPKLNRGGRVITGELPEVCCYTVKQTRPALSDFHDRLLQRIRRKGEIACEVLALEHWDLFITGVDECHCAGHQLWHVHDTASHRHDAELASRIGDPLKNVYVEIDKAVGAVADRLDSDATFLFVSSHGMGPVFDGIPLLDEILRRIEGLEPRSPAASHGRLSKLARWRQAWNRLPQPVQNVLLPLRQRFGRGSINKEGVAEAQRRKCFWLPTNDLYGGIRINLAGREAHGLVQPGREYDEFVDQLVHELHQLRDCDAGRPVVEKVIRGTDVDPEGYAGERPDLIIYWKQASFTALESPKVGRIESTLNYGRTGDHCPEMLGAFVAAGRDVAQGQLADPVRLEDFAPTIARWLQADLTDTDGSVIRIECASSS